MYNHRTNKLDGDKSLTNFMSSLDSKRSNTLALYVFLRRLKLHAFNYTIISYGYFNIRRWDKDHSTHNETAIPNIY